MSLKVNTLPSLDAAGRRSPWWGHSWPRRAAAAKKDLALSRCARWLAVLGGTWTGGRRRRPARAASSPRPAGRPSRPDTRPRLRVGGCRGPPDCFALVIVVPTCGGLRLQRVLQLSLLTLYFTTTGSTIYACNTNIGLIQKLGEK